MRLLLFKLFLILITVWIGFALMMAHADELPPSPFRDPSLGAPFVVDAKFLKSSHYASVVELIPNEYQDCQCTIVRKSKSVIPVCACRGQLPKCFFGTK